MSRTVWAHSPLDELNGETGFVVVDDDLAEKLLKAGDVQDPYLTEELHHIGSNPKKGRYATRQMTAKEPAETPDPAARRNDDGPQNGDDNADKPKRGRPPKDK